VNALTTAYTITGWIVWVIVLPLVALNWATHGAVHRLLRRPLRRFHPRTRRRRQLAKLPAEHIDATFQAITTQLEHDR
jgi:hypothetical protein